MTRTTYVIRDGKLVEKSSVYYDRSGPRGPSVITDTMDLMHNPADGRMYDSKRAYERAVRAAGCEIVGNERPKPRQREVAPGLGRTLAEVMRGERQ